MDGSKEDRPVTDTSRNNRLRKLFTSLTGLAVILCQVAVGAGTRAKAKSGEEVRRKSATEIAQEFVGLMKKGTMPWQFYQRYADIYFGRAAQAKAIAAKNKAAKGRLAAYEAYYQELGRLISEMGEHKKNIDEIELRTTSIPKKDRKKTLETAKEQHEMLLRRFIAAVKNPPKARTKR